MASAFIIFAAIIVLFAFGPGYQTLSPCPILCLVACRYIWLRKYSAWTPFLTWFSGAIGTFLAYAGCFESVKKPDIWHSKNTRKFIPLAIEISFVFTLGFVLYRTVLAQIRTHRKAIDYFLGFPVIWTSVWSIYYRLSIYGDFGNWHMALSLMEIEPLTRGVSWFFGSVSGGSYVTALVSMFLYDSFFESEFKNDEDLHVFIKAKRCKEDRPVRMFLAFLGVILAVGSYINWTPGSFYQLPIDSFAPNNTVHVSCIVRGNLETTRRLLDTKIADGNLKIVFWSETSVTTKNETFLITMAQNLAHEYDTVIGLSYLEIIDQGTTASRFKYRNKFALIVPSLDNNIAKLAFIYQKNHPVPGVEKDVEPGENSIIDYVTVNGITIAVAMYHFQKPIYMIILPTLISV